MEVTKVEQKRVWLKIARIRKGFSQKSLARNTGISAPTICAYERGINTPKPDNAMKLGKALDFNWQDFYVGEKEGTENASSGE